MRHRTTEAVFRYFNGLRAGRSAPLRSEIDPAALKSELPDLFIMEKGRDGNVRFRLAGTRVCIILGREMRGRVFADIWEPAVRHRMRLAADAVLANRTALEIAVTAMDEAGGTLALEMLLLPLFSHGDQCDRFFGSLVALGPAGPVESLSRLLTPADLAFMPVDAPESAGSRTGPQPTLSVATGTIGSLVNRITHLRVFEGGRRD